MSKWLAAKAASLLDSRTDRRGFLAKVAVVGSAVVASPIAYATRPTSAYAQICGCGNLSCDCGSQCCNGYTEFCCVIHGSNTCPPGTFLGGWWKADGSTYCSGARYYMDCNALCSCGCGGGSSFCGPSCDGLTCQCAGDNCNNMRAGCNTFRYGQCNQQIGCCGRILCRVVTCTPPWEIDASCSTTTFVDDNTAEQNAPCLQAPPPPPPPPLPSYSYGGHPGGGYYLAASNGGLFNEGGAPWLGSLAADKQSPASPVVAVCATADGGGYWVATAKGNVYNFGDATWHGSLAAEGGVPSAPVVAMVATPTAKGYWLATANGEVFNFGDATWYGSPSASGTPPPHPVVGMSVTVDSSGAATGYSLYCVAASDPPPSPVVLKY